MKRLTIQRCRFRPRVDRRGTMSGLLVVGLIVAMGLAALVLNVGQVYLTRLQLQAACEAAALAGAVELLDDSNLYGVNAPRGNQLAARLAAQAIASRHVVQGQPLQLDPNLANLPEGDIRLGYTPDPGSTHQPLLPSDSRGRCNSIVVHALGHTAQGNPVALWLGGLFGSPTANVGCAARACLDSRVIGFRPKGQTAAPIVPILLESQSWHEQRQSSLTPWNDRFRVNYATHEHREGPDGLIEIEFRCPLGKGGTNFNPHGSATNPKSGRCALLVAGGNHADVRVVERQCQTGLALPELQPWNGGLMIPLGGELPVPALERAEQIYSDSLWAIRGHRRVFALCTPHERAEQGGRWAITEFVAGVVVDAYVDFSQQPQQLVLCVQPGTIATSTAVTDPMAEEHSSICKLLLTHTSN